MTTPATGALVLAGLLAPIAAIWADRLVRAHADGEPLGAVGRLGTAASAFGVPTLIAASLVDASALAIAGLSTFGWFAAIVAAVDLRTQTIPNPLTVTAGTIVLTTLVVDQLVNGSGGDAVRVVAGAVAMFAVLLAMALISPLGLGDVKWGVAVGAALGWYSWTAVLIGGAGAWLLASVIVAAGLLSRRLDRKAPVAFGPYMAVAAVITIVWVDPINTAFGL